MGAMSKSKATLASAFALGLAALSAAGCEPAVPASPTYANDVRYILQARCVRCHDETFRGESVPGYFPTGTPLICHLNRYESTGDCTGSNVNNPMVCSAGAGLCGNIPGMLSLISFYAIPGELNSGNPTMPPPPAPKLNDWEMEVVTKWVTNLGPDGLPLP
jgi:hypothetical protein